MVPEATIDLEEGRQDQSGREERDQIGQDEHGMGDGPVKIFKAQPERQERRAEQRDKIASEVVSISKW
jgi:hypothetical protein